MIDISNRKSKSANLKPYCSFAKEHDFMEVTEWSNGEGYDITIDSSDRHMISLTHGEIECLTVLLNYRE